MGLVGRTRELAEVERLLDRAQGGTGGVVILTGPSGVGKTAMLDATAEVAAGRGFEVVYRCLAARPSDRRRLEAGGREL